MSDKELKRKLAEWRWPDAVSIQITSFTIEIAFPDNVIVIDWFTRSLNACFKWLVPKLQSEYRVYSITFDNLPVHTETEIACILHSADYETQIFYGKTPALALCKAIEQLLK